MEQENVKTVEITDFKAIGNMMDYLDNDVLVSNSITNMIMDDTRLRPVRINFFLIISCLKGEIQIEINGKTFHLQKNNIIFCLPTMILNRALITPENEIRFVGFSNNFLSRLTRKEKETDKIFYKLYKTPVWHIERDETDPLFAHFYSLVKGKIADTGNRYRKEILSHLFSAMFCEMMNELLQRGIDESEQFAGFSNKRAGYVFKRFIAEVSKDGGIHRSVSYFADLLCYSPKYISSVVKQVSGRTALEWINEYAVQQIKTELKHSEKSIKEIADQFNFPNQSFFGKYVKAHLGMSPARYKYTPEE